MEIKIDNEEAAEILKKHLERLMPGKEITVETKYNSFSFIVEEPRWYGQRSCGRPCLNS